MQNTINYITWSLKSAEEAVDRLTKMDRNKMSLSALTGWINELTKANTRVDVLNAIIGVLDREKSEKDGL